MFVLDRVCFVLAPLSLNGGRLAPPPPSTIVEVLGGEEAAGHRGEQEGEGGLSIAPRRDRVCHDMISVTFNKTKLVHIMYVSHTENLLCLRLPIIS